MKTRITFSKYWSLGKDEVLGSWLYNRDRTIQEHLETIYYIGWLRVTFIFKDKFINRKHV
jgi:hypothetical protein